MPSWEKLLLAASAAFLVYSFVIVGPNHWDRVTERLTMGVLGGIFWAAVIVSVRWGWKRLFRQDGR